MVKKIATVVLLIASAMTLSIILVRLGFNFVESLALSTVSGAIVGFWLSATGRTPI